MSFIWFRDENLEKNPNPVEKYTISTGTLLTVKGNLINKLIVQCFLSGNK